MEATRPRSECPHIGEFDRSAASGKAACEECGLPGPLRRCLTCGYVGCCESIGAHDTKHARESGHPLIRPHRADSDWLWCYECHAYLA